jgi:hypothetical protein
MTLSYLFLETLHLTKLARESIQYDDLAGDTVAKLRFDDGEQMLSGHELSTLDVAADRVACCRVGNRLAEEIANGDVDVAKGFSQSLGEGPFACAGSA